MQANLWIIDRFEGDRAVLEEVKTRAVQVCVRDHLPPSVREGDALRAEPDGHFVHDNAETARRAEAARTRLARLKKT